MGYSFRGLAIRLSVLALPLFALIAAYVDTDPFKVLRHHAVYYDDTILEPNRDVVSTELLLTSPPARYDSFIFGNSRTLALLCDDWRAHLPREATPYHFDSFGETLFGIWTKMRFLERSGRPVRSSIVMLDSSVLEQLHESPYHIYVHDRRISGRNLVSFHWIFFQEFLSKGLFLTYLDYRAFHKVRWYMLPIIGPRRFTHDPATNDLHFSYREGLIAQQGDAYFRDTILFPPRLRAEAGRPTQPVIQAGQLEMLRDIQRILVAKKADVRVVIPPLYDQRPLHPRDVALLMSLFGADRVVDLSGINDITGDVRNYYEFSHFRPQAGRAVLDRVYAPRHEAIWAQ